LQVAKLLDNCRDRVFFFRVYYSAALELVWISVADELLQSFEMLAPRERLVILFDKRNRQVSLSKKPRLYRHPANPVIFVQ
jgi:hypothetical protein